MKLPTSLTTVNWRPVAGLFLAGLLGWLLAWFMLPSGAPSLDSGTQAAKNNQPAAQQPSVTASESVAARQQPGATQKGLSLDQLLQKQNAVSEDASRSVVRLPGPQQPGSAAAPSASSGKPASPSAVEANRAARTKAMLELQTKAIAEIQAVPPGDTKKMMAAMERFDAQMRAAGAPSIIDMDNLRKTLEISNRLQELNRQLMTEAEKGRAADANKVRSLSQEIQTLQKTMPRQFIKSDVLQKQMAP